MAKVGRQMPAVPWLAARQSALNTNTFQFHGGSFCCIAANGRVGSFAARHAAPATVHRPECSESGPADHPRRHHRFVPCAAGYCAAI
jgi:hypothetical protein